MEIPPLLSAEGYMPEGVHKTNLSNIETVFGTQNERRRELFLKAQMGMVNLFKAGATKIWLDGSFTTSKEYPNDVDGIWEPGQNIDMDILDPAFLDPDFAKRKFGLDLYLNGVEGGSGQPFVEFFQTSRDGKRKGILLLEYRDYNI